MGKQAMGESFAAQHKYLDFLYGCYWPGKWSGKFKLLYGQGNSGKIILSKGKVTTDLVQLKAGRSLSDHYDLNHVLS